MCYRFFHTFILISLSVLNIYWLNQKIIEGQIKNIIINVLLMEGDL